MNVNLSIGVVTWLSEHGMSSFHSTKSHNNDILKTNQYDLKRINANQVIEDLTLVIYNIMKKIGNKITTFLTRNS